VSQSYDRDFYAWANEQAALLRAGRLSEADIAHIAEEIESLGKTEKRELVSRLRVLLLHLLKWQFRPIYRGASWRTSILNTRDELVVHLQDNPSLTSQTGEAMDVAYRRAVLDAVAETSLPKASFPPAVPWSFEQVMDDDFWPGNPDPSSKV
jgi:hypothetical protein